MADMQKYAEYNCFWLEHSNSNTRKPFSKLFLLGYFI